MLLFVFSVLFAISILLLALTAAFAALYLVPWVIVTVLRVLLWLLEAKVEPVEVADNTEVNAQVEEGLTFALTKDKDGTWVLQ
jgi:uncharacterized membrane protein